MRVIEVKSCRECPYRTAQYYEDGRERIAWCKIAQYLPIIDPRTKTFPKLCPLKEAKDG